MTKICDICKSEYETVYNQSKLCSDPCRKKYKLKKKQEERRRKKENKKDEKKDDMGYGNLKIVNINPFFLQRGEISVTGTK